MQYSKAGKKKEIALYVVAFFLLSPAIILLLNAVGNLINTLYQALHPFGQESLILGLLFMMVHIFLFFVSVVTVLNSFYFAEDIESFIPFPFQPYQILVAKAAGPFIYLYLTASVLFIPAFFFYGNVSGASFFYYLIGLVLFILIPVIPFTIASILLMAIMRFVNIAKNKDRSKIIAGILMLGFIIGINVVVRLNTDNDAIMQEITTFMQQQDGLLEMITAIYPPAWFSSKALAIIPSLAGLLYFLGIIALSIAGFFLFLWLGQLIYFKGLLGVNSGTKRKVPEAKLLKKIKQQPVWVTYTQKELRTIIRTPTFLMQCIIQSLFGPVFLVVLLLFDTNSLSGFMDMFSEKKGFLILFIAAVFILGANTTAISNLSREGKNWDTNLFLPLNPKHIFHYKIMTAWLINLLTIALFLIIFVFIFHLPTIHIIVWLLLTLVASWFTSATGTYLDFLQPKLNWTDEQEVFKARIIGLISLLIEVGIVGIVVLLLWHRDTIQGIYITSLILFVFLVIGITIVHWLLYRKLRNDDHRSL